MPHKVSIVGLLFVFGFLQAQEPILFSNDCFSGISSVAISPTQPFINPNPWDVHLFSEDIFVQNDYGYVSQQSFLGLKDAKIKSASRKNNITGGNSANVFDYYNKDFANYHLSSNVMGPSFSYNTTIKEREFSFGFFTRVRTQSSALKLDNYLRFGNENILEPEIYQLDPLHINLMNWGEVGLNVATEVFPYSNYQWVVGANFKYEMGFDALNIRSLSPINLTRTEDIIDSISIKTISAENYHVKLNYATNYNFETKEYNFKKRGNGLGLDLGIVVIDREEGEDNYNLKAGFNILDIGYVNFHGENHYFEGSKIKLENNPNFENTKFRSPQQYLHLISNEVYGNPYTSLQGTDFTMGLPTAMHANFSKNVGENQYLGFDWFQRLPIFENSLKRSNVLNVSYTVQKPVLGYGTSLSIYEYRAVQMGAYLRLGPLILGSENFLPLIFKQKKLHSGDFFIGLKLYPFWDNEMKRHRRRKCNC